MGKIEIEAAFIYSKRADVRDVVRQALKVNGLDTNNIQNIVKESNILKLIEKSDFAFLILDWELGAETINRVLEANRKASAIESHPVYLLAAREDENIFKTAKEFFVSRCTIGDITTDSIRGEIRGLVSDYRRLSPIRQVLLNVENAKRLGEDDQAFDMITKLHSKTPDNPRVIVEFAEALIGRGEWKKAEDILRPVLDTEPPYARIKHLYARCRLKAADYNSAIASLKGAQLVSPYNTERLLEMADLFLDLDRPDEANDAYDEILKIAPSYKHAKLGKSKSMLLAGELNEALTLLRECASHRELSSVFNTAAIIAIKQEKYEVGFGLYKKAIGLLAKHTHLLSRIVYNMGIGFVKTGDSEKGLMCFKKSHQLDPDFKNAGFNVKVLEKSKEPGKLQLEELKPVEFEETIIHEDEPENENPKSKIEELEQGAVDNLDLDAIFDSVENF